MDRLQELCAQVGGKITAQDNYNLNLKAKSSRRVLVRNYKQSNWKIEIEDYGDMLLVGLKANSKFAFSINRPDNIFGYTKKVSVINTRFPVYTSDGRTPFPDPLQLRFFDALSLWLENLQLASDESVFIYNNYVYLAVKAARDLLSIINTLVDLVEIHKNLFHGQKIRSGKQSQLPIKLRALFPLMDKWAVSDDVERNDLVSSINKMEREALIAVVDPLMGDINDFLESFKDLPLSDEAMRLGNFAELVSELKLSI